jgi:hypothetical protein
LAAGEIAEDRVGQPPPRLGEVAGQRHDAAPGWRGELVAGRGPGDAAHRVGLVPRPDQAVDLGAGGGEQLAEQVGAQEPGRPGEQDLVRVAPVRPGSGRGPVPPDRQVEPGLGREVDLGLVVAGAEPARAGVAGGGGEPAQGGVAQQAAGERPHRVRRDAEDRAGPGQHLRGQ